MSHRLATMLAGLVLPLIVASPGRAADFVTACGVEVANGILTADLDCTSFEVGMWIEDGGSLDLAGHTLTPGDTTGIACLGDCTIFGGRIAGGDRHAITNWLGSRGTIRVTDAEISNNIAAISGDMVRVTGSRIEGNPNNGVYAARRITVAGSTVSGNGYAGLEAGRSVSVVDSTLSANVRGALAGRRISIDGSVVSASDEIGVSARRVIARDSTISGSGAACPDPASCYDIGSAAPPRIVNVTCDESVRLSREDGSPTSESWQICAGD